MPHQYMQAVTLYTVAHYIHCHVLHHVLHVLQVSAVPATASGHHHGKVRTLILQLSLSLVHHYITLSEHRSAVIE